jgi:hypothetical protein
MKSWTQLLDRRPWLRGIRAWQWEEEDHHLEEDHLQEECHQEEAHHQVIQITEDHLLELQVAHQEALLPMV